MRVQIAAVESALESKRANILSRIRNEFESSRRMEGLLSAKYTSQRGLIAKQASKVLHYADLKREVDTTRQLYDSMFQKVTEAAGVGDAGERHSRDRQYVMVPGNMYIELQKIAYIYDAATHNAWSNAAKFYCVHYGFFSRVSRCSLHFSLS